MNNRHWSLSMLGVCLAVAVVVLGLTATGSTAGASNAQAARPTHSHGHGHTRTPTSSSSRSSTTVSTTSSSTTKPSTSSTPPPPPSSTSPPGLQPVGDPLGRVWTPSLDDEFNGTAIDTSKWVALNGWGNNNVTSNAKNCTESGGNLVLALPGDGTGCDLYSSKHYGAGSNAHDLLVGDYLEARIYFPGPGTAPTSTLYNWPAFWAYDGSGNWLAGENDVAEALNWMEYNYSSEQKSGKLKPTGLWGNSWHVYGVYRSATSVQVFYDGVLMGTLATNDNGGPESIMFTSGKTNTCCGAPTAYGSTGNVLVDWVRDWH